MRYLLPPKTLCADVIKILGLDPDKFKYNIKSKVIQENSGTLQVAKFPRTNPGNKLISVKYNWFHDNIHNRECTVENIGGDFQKADILKKRSSGITLPDN